MPSPPSFVQFWVHFRGWLALMGRGCGWDGAALFILRRMLSDKPKQSRKAHRKGSDPFSRPLSSGTCSDFIPTLFGKDSWGTQIAALSETSTSDRNAPPFRSLRSQISFIKTGHWLGSRSGQSNYSFVCDRVPKNAYAFDLNLHDISWSKENRWRARVADTGWRAHGDQVAR